MHDRRGHPSRLSAGRRAGSTSGVRRRGVFDDLSAPPTVQIVGDRLELRLEAVADYIIAPALPGGPDGTPVTATVTVRLAIDDG